MEYGRGPGGEIHEDRGVTWFATGLPDPLFNGVMTAQLAREEVDERIDELQAEFQSRDLPLEWTVGSSTKPRDLGENLLRKGLTNRLVVPGMAMDLGSLPEVPVPDGLTIQRPDTPQELETCIRIACVGFQIAEPLVRKLVDIERSMPADHRESTVLYLGRMRGEPVASTTLFLSAGVAGLYFVSTLPAARGRGIGGAMAAWALQEARNRGYRIGTLQATEMGLPVYRGLGFREYGRFEIYNRWSPTEPLSSLPG
jgi:GNAT superfamily N-acetyltransferase